MPDFEEQRDYFDSKGLLGKCFLERHDKTIGQNFVKLKKKKSERVKHSPERPTLSESLSTS